MAIVQENRTVAKPEVKTTNYGAEYVKTDVEAVKVQEPVKEEPAQEVKEEVQEEVKPAPRGRNGRKERKNG